MKTDTPRISSLLNLENTLLQLPVAVAICRGPEFIVELANEAMLRLLGVGTAGFLEHPLFADGSAHPIGGLKNIFSQVYSTGERKVISEYLVESGDAEKETGYFNFAVEVLRDEKQTISGVTVLANDVTGSVHARKKIEEAEKKQSMALEAGRFGTWDFDLVSDTVELDARCRELFGMPLKKHIAPLDFWEYIHPHDHQKVREGVSASLDPVRRADYTLEYRVFAPDGQIRWIRNKGKGYFEGRVPYRFIGTVQDITEERALRDQQEKLLCLVDNSVELMSLLGTDNINSYINKAGMELLGFDTVEEVLRTPISELHQQEDYEHVSAEVITSLQTHGRWSGVMKVKHLKTGEIIPVYNNTVRIDDPESGEVLAFGAVMRDMRPELAIQRSLEESALRYKNLTNELEARVDERTADLRNANLNLSRSNRDLEQFAYVASHDLQEPIRKIRIFTDLMQQNLGDTESLKAYLSKIDGSARRMSALVKGLLNYSRLSSPDSTLEPVDLSLVLASVLSDSEVAIREKEAVIEVSRLPVISGVRVQLHQLFSNLLGNALKFTERTPHITVTASEADAVEISGAELIDPAARWHRITFADNGIGIPAHLSEKVFTVFTRGTSDPRFTGTGIGLAVCKKVVENHRGHIAVESEPGKGSVFHVYFPAE